MGYIYQREETRARFRLSQFLLSIGTPEISEKANTNGISSEEILRVFGMFYREDAQYLTPTTVEHFLLAGGWLAKEEAYNQLYLKITPEKFTKLTKDVQAFILNWIPYPAQVTFRGIYNGYTEKHIAPDKILVNNFIQQFCIDCRILGIKQYIQQKTAYRSSAEEIYQYFRLICETYGINNIPIKKRFYELLQNNYQINVCQGVVRGKSGVRTLMNHIFPSTDVDMLLSLQYGTSIITINNDTPSEGETEIVQIYPGGRFDSLTSVQKLTLQETKIRRFAGDAFEQTEKLESSSMGQITDRTETEIYAPIEQAAKEGIMEERSEVSRGEENNLSKLVRDDTRLQELEDAQDESERTSDRDESSVAAEQSPQDESADIEHEELYDSDIEYEDEYGTDTVEASSDAIEELGSDPESDDRSAEEEEVDPYETTEDWPEPMYGTEDEEEEEEVFDPLEDDEEAKAFLNSPPDDEVEEPIVVTFEHILNMCKAVPMYQDPAILTVETLQSLMDKMNTDLKAIDIYKDLLAELTKWKEGKDK